MISCSLPESFLPSHSFLHTFMLSDHSIPLDGAVVVVVLGEVVVVVGGVV